MYGEIHQWKDSVMSSRYHIYLCLSQPFETQKLLEYMALGLYMGDEFPPN